jgi:hypothetical protein
VSFGIHTSVELSSTNRGFLFILYIASSQASYTTLGNGECVSLFLPLKLFFVRFNIYTFFVPFLRYHFFVFIYNSQLIKAKNCWQVWELYIVPYWVFIFWTISKKVHKTNDWNIRNISILSVMHNTKFSK